MNVNNSLPIGTSEVVAYDEDGNVKRTGKSS